MTSSKCVSFLLVSMALLITFQCGPRVCVCEKEQGGGEGGGGGGGRAMNHKYGTQLEEDDDLEVEVEEEEEEMDIFEPTHEWKSIRRGQVIPPGLHVRMNMQTGEREAKLMSEKVTETAEPTPERQEDKETPDTQDAPTPPPPTPASGEPARSPAGEKTQGGLGKDTKSSDSARRDVPSFQFPGDRRRSHYFGHSDRRGIINKRRRAFSQREVAEMLKKMEEETVDFSKLPGIAHTHTIPEDFKLNLAYQEKEPSTKKTHAVSQNQEKEHVAHHPRALHRELAQMMEHSRTLARQTSSVQELLHALEELEYHVHQIDNAQELNSIGGLVLVVRLLNHSHPEIRSSAAHVVGAATQSNPHVQKEALDYGALELLCRFISANEPDVVQRRGLFALSALMRGSTHTQLAFLQQCRGLKQLADDFHNRSPQTQLKAVTLLTDLLYEQRELLYDSEQLRLLLHSHVQEHHWCQHVPTLLHSETPTSIEKALQAMSELQHMCDFSSHLARLQELSYGFEKVTEKQEDEVAKNLLQHTQQLLSTIRQRNREEL